MGRKRIAYQVENSLVVVLQCKRDRDTLFFRAELSVQAVQLVRYQSPGLVASVQLFRCASGRTVFVIVELARIGLRQPYQGFSGSIFDILHLHGITKTRLAIVRDIIVCATQIACDRHCTGCR